MIVSVVDTGDKFIIGDNGNGEQLSSAAKAPAISLFLVTTTPVIRVWGMSMDESFHGSSNSIIGPCPTKVAWDIVVFGLK